MCADAHGTRPRPISKNNQMKPNSRPRSRPNVYKIIMNNLSEYSLILLCAVLLAGCNSQTQQRDAQTSTDTEAKKARASASMEAASGTNVTGEATFVEEDGKVRFELSVKNVSPGVHAVHLHEKGDCGAEDASSAGGHWNPTMKPHGKRGSGGSYHKGDVGNMEVGDDGKGTLNLLVEGWSIGGADSTNVLGKSVIIHDKADDFTSQPSGNAGSRISCGVIKRN